MKVADARRSVVRWVGEQGAATAGFAGAFLSGSAAWLPDAADLAVTSDVDVMVVTTQAEAPPKLGKLRWEGLLVDVTYLSWDRISSAEAILGSYHLAGSFGKNTILADPTGRLARLRAAVAPEYARRSWVRRRCEDAEQRIIRRVGVRSGSLPEQVLSWIFPTGVTTHVLLTAGLRNPTIRLRYLAARELLAEYGHAGAYDELLRLLGCADLTPAEAEGHLRAMSEVFDATVPLSRTPFSFSSDITAAARPIAVDGGRDLLARGLHREAMFWIVATYARCLTILAADAPAVHADFLPGFGALMATLGIASAADLTRRTQDVLGYLPRLRRLTEKILAANPRIHD